MKNVLIINGLAVVLALASYSVFAADSSAGATKHKSASATADSGDAKASHDMKYNMGYFFGYSFGNMLKQGGHTDLDMKALQKGMEDSLANNPPDMTREEQQAVIAVLQADRKKQMDAEKKAKATLDSKQTAEAEKNLEASMKFMEKNAQKPGVVATADGLQYKIIKKGTGKRPTADDMVKVNYTGKLLDGTVFDTSKGRGPAEFRLKQVIPGWTEGLQLMREGAVYRFFIPPDLAYGSGGTHGIPPNSALIFDVHLLKVNPKGSGSDN